MDWRKDMDDSGGNGLGIPRWENPQANLIMDVHGDPVNASLIIFSDGNHHMALRRTVTAFKKKIGGDADICFFTTPPGPLIKMTQGKKLVLGNLELCLCPHVFIGPPQVLDKLVAAGQMGRHLPFCKNQGSVLLVKKSNPWKIKTVEDLTQPGFRLFLSSPDREKDSRQSYETTLKCLSGDEHILDRLNIVSGQFIHHREALEAVDSGRAHGAMLFFHLALHYSGIFPERFEMMPLGRTKEEAKIPQGCPVNTTHAGIVGNGGPFGQNFLEFLFSPETANIYRDCGLLPLVSSFT